jgi:hypothetical protein
MAFHLSLYFHIRFLYSIYNIGEAERLYDTIPFFIPSKRLEAGIYSIKSDENRF